MVTENYQESEWVDFLIHGINTDAKEVKGRLERKDTVSETGYPISFGKKSDDIRWDIILESIGTLYQSENALHEYCITNNPPKDYKHTKSEKGNIQCFGGHRPNLPKHLKEYDFANVDPEGFRDCQEYWKSSVTKAKIEMIEAFQHICEGKKPPIKKYYLG